MQIEPFDPQFNDASISSDFDETYLEKLITFSVAKSAKSSSFDQVRWSVREFLTYLSVHREGNKDGPIIMPGSLKGRRRRAGQVLAMSMMLFDIDDGQMYEAVKAWLVASGLAYVMWTSHSHGKATTIARLDHVLASLGLPPAAVVTVELLRQYLATRYAGAVAESAFGFDLAEVDGAVQISIHHDPMDKFRAGVVLAQPFQVSDYPTWQEAQQAWAGYVEAVAAWAGIRYDRACADLPRGFYFPRHAPGRPFKVAMGGGRLLDLDDFSPLRPTVSASRVGPKRSRTDAAEGGHHVADVGPHRSLVGELLERLGEDLSIVDLLVNKVGWETRGVPKATKAAILCPNNDAHSHPDDTDDRGCVVMNPDATGVGRAVITCRHEHCLHLGTADFLAMIFNQVELEGIQ